MRPMLAPGMRWAWRSPTTVQFGIDVPDPMVVDGLPPFAQRLLPLLDGHRPLAEVVAALAAAEGGCPADADVLALIERLAELGIVVDGGSWPGALSMPPDLRAQLAPDLRSASAIDRMRSKPAARWHTLGASEVVIVGASRLGATIARTLVGAALGRVTIRDSRRVTPGDVSAGGFGPDDVGLRRSEWLSCRAESVGRRPSDAETRRTGSREVRYVVPPARRIDSSRARSTWRRTSGQPPTRRRSSRLIVKVPPARRVEKRSDRSASRRMSTRLAEQNESWSLEGPAGASFLRRKTNQGKADPKQPRS